MAFKLTRKQKELLYSVSYKEFKEKDVAKSTVGFLRKKTDHMKIGTLERILEKVWNITLKEFFSL